MTKISKKYIWNEVRILEEELQAKSGRQLWVWSDSLNNNHQVT